MIYKKENIRSIGELMNCDGGRTLTPVFDGKNCSEFVRVNKDEFEAVRGDIEAMKDLAISKLNKL